jgi:glutathione S-transferase
MKIFDGGKAPNPRRVQIFLKEKGIDVERVELDINALEQKSEAFEKLNPMMTLPVLQLDDGTVIAETIAICRYFEEIQPDPPLFGVGAIGKAHVEMWQRRLELNFLLPVAFAFRHLHPAAKVLESEQVEQWGKLNQARAIKFMTMLDKELSSRPFIVGEKFSVADITGLVACQFLKPARIQMPEELRHLDCWLKEVSSRPSAAW